MTQVVRASSLGAWGVTSLAFIVGAYSHWWRAVEEYQRSAVGVPELLISHPSDRPWPFILTALFSAVPAFVAYRVSTSEDPPYAVLVLGWVNVAALLLTLFVFRLPTIAFLSVSTAVALVLLVPIGRLTPTLQPSIATTPLILEPIMAASFPAFGSPLGANGVLRTSPLPHRRVNAVWAYGSGITQEHIAEAEATYGAREQDVVFKVSGVPSLDAALRAAGYVEEGPTPVFALATEVMDYPDHIVLTDRQDLESAIRYWMLFTEKPNKWLPLYVDSYRSCAGRLGLAFALDGSQVASVGMVHSYLSVAVISNVATSPDHYKQGHGYAITQALMAWAHRQGANTTALQVEADNDAALRIYRKLGFEKAYDSWYLRKARNEPIE